MRRGTTKSSHSLAPLDDSASILDRLTRSHSDHGDEVEELLRAAQENVFLSLNVDTHRLHCPPLPPPPSFPSGLDSDLDRRLAALRVPPKQQPNTGMQSAESKKSGDVLEGDSEDPLDAELCARFLALKGSMKGDERPILALKGSMKGDDFGIGGGEEEDFESEVKKLMEWAKDAARLDPSCGEHDEDDHEDDDYDSDETESQDDEEDEESDADRGKKKKKKGKVVKNKSSK